MKLEFPRQIFTKYSDIKLWWKSVQWEPSCSMRTAGQTHRHGEADSSFPQFC